MSLRRPKREKRILRYQIVLDLVQKHLPIFRQWYKETYGKELSPNSCIPCIVKDIMKTGDYRKFEDYLPKSLQ